jgi:hypothetical protein
MRSVLRRVVVAASFVAAVAGTPPPAAADSLQPFIALLNAPQENPPRNSSAQGLAFVTLNTTNKQLCYAISYQGLTTAEILAHFHGPAAPGQNAGIVFDISPSPSPLGSPKQGCVGPLNKQQMRDLRNGLYYINIHTTQFTGGEIRGQVLPQRGVRYKAPAIVVPPPGSPSGAFLDLAG